MFFLVVIFGYIFFGIRQGNYMNKTMKYLYKQVFANKMGVKCFHFKDIFGNLLISLSIKTYPHVYSDYYYTYDYEVDLNNGKIIYTGGGCREEDCGSGIGDAEDFDDGEWYDGEKHWEWKPYWEWLR